MVKVRLSLHTNQVAHQAGAYTVFCSVKRLGVFLLHPGTQHNVPARARTRTVEGGVRKYHLVVC